jgi:hypothetical protein
MFLKTCKESAGQKYNEYDVQACKNIYIHNAGTTSKGITIVESGVK